MNAPIQEGNTATSPLYFVRSGYVNSSGYLNYAGSYGRHWSGRAVSSMYAYLLNFYSSVVHPSDLYDRHYGISVRCVAGWE